MNTENKTWKNLQAEYLNKVEKALSLVKHPNIAEVLEDVKAHLQVKFSKLKPEEQSREKFEAIIAEMGPANDYAELLGGKDTWPKKGAGIRYMAAAGALIIIIGAAILVPMMLSPASGYIIEFKAAEPFKPQTAKELLDKFNNEIKFGVATHHFRTEVNGNTLIGYICTDTKADKGAITTLINKSKLLKLISVTAASSGDLEKHYLKGQPSLPNAKEREAGAAPLVVRTTPEAFSDYVSSELKEITVTFDRQMMNLSWSWVGGGNTFPEMAGEPYYDKDKKTCRLPVRLEPGKYYWVGINSLSYKNFQTDMGEAALPYVILFATKDSNGNSTPIPENFITEAKEINSQQKVNRGK